MSLTGTHDDEVPGAALSTNVLHDTARLFSLAITVNRLKTNLK